MAKVIDFDGAAYQLRAVADAHAKVGRGKGGDNNNNNGGDDDDAAWVIDLTKDEDNDGWRNAPLPLCGGCAVNEADVALLCHCAIPRVCRVCATTIDTCPKCHHRVARDVHCARAPCGNVFAIEASPTTRSFSRPSPAAPCR